VNGRGGHDDRGVDDGYGRDGRCYRHEDQSLMELMLWCYSWLFILILLSKILQILYKGCKIAI